MRSLVASLAAAPLLSGCFFVFIPGALIDQVAGNPAYCVGARAKVGDKFRVGENIYEITRLAGESPYVCRNQPEHQRMGADARIVVAGAAPPPSTAPVAKLDPNLPYEAIPQY